jgi:DNA-cytosine methyltransferase
MRERQFGVTVLDLFCGAGGFSEGFRQAGFDVVFGIDNWEPACRTYEINNLGEVRKLDFFDLDVEKIISLKEELNRKYGEIDVVVGSPPCVEFSYAKNGGQGNIEKGMILVRRFLLFVAVFRPKYWLMENVPRLRDALNRECAGSIEKGWSIHYKKLGIPQKRLKELGISGTSLKIPKGDIVEASDFGTHQNRRRFIAGDFPLEEVSNQEVTTDEDRTLGKLLQAIETNLGTPDKEGLISDPNYPSLKVGKDQIRDYDYNTLLHPMHFEQMRYLKRRHIQYGRMSLPENLKAPARTIVATWFPGSRESLIFKTRKKVKYHGRLRPIFRQPTVREIACIQGFPINFQLDAARIKDRYMLVGNAVPCELAYALAKSISCDIPCKLSSLNDRGFNKRVRVTLTRQRSNNHSPIISKRAFVVGEAADIHKYRGKCVRVNSRFCAKPTKHIRRKLLSSKLGGENSCVVIFDNTSLTGGKISGGPFWKSYMQRGIGKRYHRICLDEVSVPQIIGSLNASSNAQEMRNLLQYLLKEVKRGAPFLENGWIEFPGWSQEPESYLSFISEKRLKLPTVSFFQRAFTEDLRDIGDFVGPIDFFDGLDAILLLVFSKEKFQHLQDEMIHVESLYDSGKYHYKPDSRVVTQLVGANVPLVTLMSCLLSVEVLGIMYEMDGSLPENESYSESLRTARESMKGWEA